ncbi:hypothetical protein [Prosthecomicrobium sp. N25]|uniref:hypothetical protein n=1 Tax=Prosthecomicrobium sp. N25 TaxID=3129254 RepID=UPI003077064E
MSTAAREPAAQTESPGLGAVLGLDPQEAGLFAGLLAEALDGLGMDGSRVVAGLQAGRSVGDSLALPAGVADLLYARAHHWFAAGRYDRAEDLFRTLCVVAPTRTDHWLGFGICLRLRGQGDEARRAFEAAAMTAPDSLAVEFHRLELALAEGRAGDAARHLESFDARVTDETPAEMRAEVERFRLALALRRREGVPP